LVRGEIIKAPGKRKKAAIISIDIWSDDCYSV